MDTLCTEAIQHYPDAVKVFDVRRPGVWCLFEVTAGGVRLVQSSCESGRAMCGQAQLLAALAV